MFSYKFTIFRWSPKSASHNATVHRLHLPCFRHFLGFRGRLISNFQAKETYNTLQQFIPTNQILPSLFNPARRAPQPSSFNFIPSANARHTIYRPPTPLGWGRKWMFLLLELELIIKIIEHLESVWIIPVCENPWNNPAKRTAIILKYSNNPVFAQKVDSYDSF